MSSVDLIVVGQSNVFQTDTRTAAAGVLQQSDVPTWYAWHHTISTLPLKVKPWASLDARYRSFPVTASRQWAAAPEFCVRRLIDTHGHQPRLIDYGVGSSRIYDHWPTTYGFTAIAGIQIAAALAHPRYPGTPTRRVIVTIQGESDTQLQAAVDAYGTSYATWIAALRTAVGDANCHVICVQLNTNQSIGVANGLTDIRVLQAAWVAGDANATIYDPSSLPSGGGISGDSIHYSQAGSQALGEAIADIVDGLL